MGVIACRPDSLHCRPRIFIARSNNSHLCGARGWNRRLITFPKMEESLEAFKAKLQAYRNFELRSIQGSLDREKHPDRHQALLDEIARRQQAGVWFHSEEPASKKRGISPVA